MAVLKKEKKEKKLNNKEKTEKTKSKKSFKQLFPFLFKKKKKEEIEVLDLDDDTSKKKSTKKKKKNFVFAYSKVEFVFNFLSLVFVICVALYYGGRSFYYYSLQNKEIKETAQTLNGQILANNKLAKNPKDDGLHQDEDGYFFKGNITTNYVMFANRMFRVMRVFEDNSVKLISDDLVASFVWGDYPQYEGSNLHLWLSPRDDIEVSGIYYKTIPSPDYFLKNTTYTIDILEEGKVEHGDIEFEDKVVSVSLNDYIQSGGKSGYLNNGKLYFLLGYRDEDTNLYVEEDGSVAECSNLDGYGVRAVITLNRNIPISGGTGTKDDPYVVDQGDNKNYVDSYVKLGKDTWRVFEEKDGILKMYLNDYIRNEDGSEVSRQYSWTGSLFYYYDDGNIGWYLANDYYNSLSYKDLIVDNTYPYGEYSAETGYSFVNVFNNSFTGKMALLNLFDYVSNNELSDYYRDVTSSELSHTQYAILANGAMDEVDVWNEKHIVPVISIKADSIKSGSGRKDDPYKAG